MKSNHQGARTTERPRASAATNSESERSSANRWPELRIMRKANYEAGEADEWNDFLNDLGSRNYGKGHAASLGSMACVFVDAQAMGRMLGKKYRKAFENRKSTEQLQRSFARNFNGFVRSQEKARIDARFDKKTKPYANCRNLGLVAIGDELLLPSDSTATSRAGTDMPDDYDIILHPDELLELEIEAVGDRDEMRWNQGSFAVRALEKYGNNDIALDLSGNQQLYEEWEDVRSYLKSEQLDVNLMKAQPNGQFLFEPHASCFETFGPAGQIALQYSVERPRAIPLDSPHAYLNTNR